MTPSVGRIVHYTPEEGVCYAALVIHVGPEGPWVNVDTGVVTNHETTILTIFPPSGHFYTRTVNQGTAVGTWHEPERVA